MATLTKARSSEQLDYRYTPSGEPHRARRAAILKAHPEIRSLFGWDPLPKYRMAAVLVVQLVLAWAVQSWWAVLPLPLGMLALVGLAYVLGAPMNHYGGVIIHEATHNLCARTRVQNRLVGIFANLATVLPYAMTFRRYHLQHHISLGVLGEDNDLPKDFERRLVGNSRVRKLVWLILYPVAGTLLRGFLRRLTAWELLGIGVQLGFNLAVYLALGPVALVYLAVSTFFSASLHPIAGHFIHEHYLWNEAQETYSYYGPLNKITLNMGYHVEHHDFMSVPGRDLPRLHAIAHEYYEGLTAHRSWTQIFYTFVKNPRLSHHSRFVRTLADLRTAKVTTLPIVPLSNQAATEPETALPPESLGR